MAKRIKLNLAVFILSLLPLAISLVFFNIARGIKNLHLHWKDLPVKNMSVDLSKPGRYESEFVHTYLFADGYGCNIELLLPQSSTTTSDPRTLIEGLKGNVSILDSEGNEMLRDPNHGDFPNVKYKIPTDLITLHDHVRIDMQRGKYKFIMSVKSGANSLEEVDQLIRMSYRQWGVEKAYVLWAALPGIVLVIISLFILFRSFRTVKYQDNQ